MSGGFAQHQTEPRFAAQVTGTAYQLPRVFLVGAGPGNPGLLTIRAAECMAQAEVVIYDRLVPRRLLDFAPEAAARLCVDSLPGRHAERSPHIIAALLDAAGQGKVVVRLKGGDPFLFGRGAEEAEALREAGISYEIVPGVTSGLASAIYAGIPLTHRLHASAVALVTGHECPDKPGAAVDWATLARFPGTLVIYMGMSRLPNIVQALMDNGMSTDTPAAVIRWGTMGEQKTLAAPLSQLPSDVRHAGLTPPGLVVIGPAAAMRSQLAWWEQRPLFGKRVLVTRPRHQIADMLRRLEVLGATAQALPMVEIREPLDWSPVDRALAGLGNYDWLVFTSANGVHALIRRLRQIGRDLRALGSVQLAAIGPGTAEAIRAYHLEPDLVPARYDSEALAAALTARAAGKRLLLARADRGRELLREELTQVAQVEQIAVYSQIDVGTGGSPALDAVRQGEIDYITVTSSNIARALHRSLEPEAREWIASGKVQLVSISRVTSAAIRELGWPIAAEASEATMNGVIEALILAASKEEREPV